MTPSERAAIDDRIRWLQRRTVGVGWTASVCLVVGAIATLLALGELAGRILGGRGDDLVAFHVPAGLRHADGAPWLSVLFVGLALAGAWGLSTGRLRRAHGAAALMLCLLIGIADISLSAPLHQPLFALPSRLERLGDSGEYAEAERLAQGSGGAEHRAREHYVRAQIALRAGDVHRLESLGRPLLQDADMYAYSGSTHPNIAHVYGEAMRELRVSVLAAIDRRLHGAPISAAGIAAATEPHDGPSKGMRAAALAACGLGLGAAGVLLAALWRRMRGNVLRIIDLDA
jgi:hypothetical protein